MKELPKQYEPAKAESHWYSYWESNGYFEGEANPARDPFCIVIPPPNVTGALHLGHALNNTLQDILIRRKRMQGFETLWMPGTDHAGIATQAVVERRLLQEEKISRHDLGREGLVERIWKWKNDYETRILGQLKRLGCSCDWRRTRFTLDPICARAVRHTFFKLFRDRLIFRGKRLVNWDTMLQTAVSDDEVFHETVAGQFWYFRYPVIDPKPGEPAFVTVATTRPETMLGDTAVAVHPDPAAALEKAEQELSAKLDAAPIKQKKEIEAEYDALRSRKETILPHLIQLRDMALDGRKIMLPLQKRAIPLITDEWAKPELGTGCVKITPAHDPNDYEVGLRRSLPMINILEKDGTLGSEAGVYRGLTIQAARKKVVEDLTAEGLVESSEDRQIELAHSDRSKTPIEPLLTDQWFVHMDQLAQTAMDAVSSGRIKIYPERYAKGYLDWLAEKRDWPISRQLWWGHQIPIWYLPDASEEELQKAFKNRNDISWTYDENGKQWLICAQEEDLTPDAVPGHLLRREEDVLDTWFSSALWPHSTLGWPKHTPELDYFYPTSVLITSRDIITLWVARMVLAGLYNTGEIPFKEVYIHPKILDGFGEGMSKSKGNGVDPIDVMDKFGADALRFAIAYLTTETQDIRMPVEFECPHCGKLIEQTRENRIRPRLKCKHCSGEFSTQWADKEADKLLPRGPVVSERFELARNFCNKLWNASRFVLMNLDDFDPAIVSDAEVNFEDAWLLSRLSTVTQRVSYALEEYKYADAARALYDFAWDDFCSFYLEMVKDRLQNPEDRAVAQRILVHVLDVLLRLLHPFIPFLTEEIWQLLKEIAPQRGLQDSESAAESIIIAPWPEADLLRCDEEIEKQFSRFQDILRNVRDIRAKQNVPPKTILRLSLRCDEETAELLAPLTPYFASMAKAEVVECGPATSPSPLCATATLTGIEIFIDLEGLIDVEAEIERKLQDIQKLKGFIAAKESKLSNASFISRAPIEVVQKEKESLAELVSQKEGAEKAIEQLRSTKR